MKYLRESILMGFVAAICLSASASESLPTKPMPSEVPDVQIQEEGTTPTVIGTSPDPIEARRTEHLKYLESLDARTAGFTPLERLALSKDLNPPAFSDVVPYRFSGTDKLEQLLADPAWVKHWWPIAVTIAMAANEKEADWLISFIQSDETVPGLEKQSLEAKFASLGALHYVVVDQSAPSVMAFLRSLTNTEYTSSLAVSRGYSPLAVKKLAEDVLALIATDEAIAILQSSKADAEGDAARSRLQASDGDAAYELKRLASLIDNAKRRQAGLPLEPPATGDPTP